MWLIETHAHARAHKLMYYLRNPIMQIAQQSMRENLENASTDIRAMYIKYCSHLQLHIYDSIKVL